MTTIDVAGDQAAIGRDVDGADPLILVSSDSHIGPRLKEDLRPYCESRYLDDFDRFAAEEATRRAEDVPSPLYEHGVEDYLHNQATAGHYDMAARRRDMDYDGVACEVIFHGSQNGQTIPFMPLGKLPSGNVLSALSPLDMEMSAVGQHIYNRWLADAVSTAPDRHVGLIQIPIWNPGQAIREVNWGIEAGLRGVNFPAPRSYTPSYASEAWEGLWQACTEHNVALHTHGGAGDPALYTGVGSHVIMVLESSGWLARRAMHFLIFGGIFDRYPDLKIIFTEQPGVWWPAQEQEYDSLMLQFPVDSKLRQAVKHMPSEYMRRNVYIGASFVSRREAAAAVAGGYWSRVLWGTDYPHSEGTFRVPTDSDEEPQTRSSLRYSLAGLEYDQIAGIVGGNAVDALGLDRSRLTAVAAQIGAPTARQLSEPLAAIPAVHGDMSFRVNGPYS